MLSTYTINKKRMMARPNATSEGKNNTTKRRGGERTRAGYRTGGRPATQKGNGWTQREREEEGQRVFSAHAVLEFLILPTEICPSQAKHGRQETPNTERGIIVGEVASMH
jgi:hypothetical protein